MVKGIDQFKVHFEGFSDRYVLIGGAACFLALDEAGLDFRVTKDLDIVLCVEAVTTDPPQTLKPFGLGGTKFDEIVEMLLTIYELRT